LAVINGKYRSRKLAVTLLALLGASLLAYTGSIDGVAYAAVATAAIASYNIANAWAKRNGK